MRKALFSLLLLGSSLTYGAAITSTTTVLGGTPLTTFEGFADGTLMQNQIAGVTFGQAPLAGRPQIDNSPFLFGYVASSGIGVLTGSTEGGYPFPTVAGITISFASGVSAAEVYFSDTSPLGNYTVSAFNTSGGLIESFVLLASQLGATGQYVGFQYGSNQLGKLQLGPSSTAGDAFAIDDLRVRSTSSGVPEPSTWMLMAGGLGALALRRRR
ncbi:MAG: PEP-CTERM sorting domain-containing protein [Acidobacteriota bacterium]